MKKLVFTLFVLILSKTSFAQSSFHPGLRFNPIISWLRAESENENVTVTGEGIRMGFSVGLMGDYFFADNYGIAMEARITQLSGKFSHTITNIPGVLPSEENKYTLQYLEIPISLKMKTNEIGYSKYYGQAGIIPAINTRARADIIRKVPTYFGKEKEEENNVNIKPQISGFDLFVMIGGGMEYTLSGSTAILAGISYQHGLMNLSDDKTYTLKNRYLALNLGILF